MKAVLFCIIFGIFWPIVPIFGWSNYQIDQNYIGCSIQPLNLSNSTLSYNICIYIFVYFLPLSILIFTNYHIVTTVSLQKFLNEFQSRNQITNSGIFFLLKVCNRKLLNGVNKRSKSYVKKKTTLASTFYSRKFFKMK